MISVSFPQVGSWSLIVASSPEVVIPFQNHLLRVARRDEVRPKTAQVFQLGLLHADRLSKHFLVFRDARESGAGHDEDIGDRPGNEWNGSAS